MKITNQPASLSICSISNERPRKAQAFSAPVLHFLAAALLFCAVGASAGQLTWDPLNNGGTIPGNGNWDTTSTNTVWYNGTSDVAWTQTSGSVGLNGAIFGGMDGNWAVTNDVGEIAVTNLTINNSGYAFYGNNAIYIGSDDFLTVAPGKTVTINCPMAGSGTEPCWVLGSGSVMNFTGNLATGQQLRLAGPSDSAYYLSGANTPAITWILAPVYVTNGSFTPVSSFYIGYAETLPAPNSTAYTSGTLTVSGSSTATFNGNILIISRGGGSGTLNVNGGTVNVGNMTASRNLAICYDSSANASATVNVNNGGTLNVGSPSLLGNAIDFFDTGTSATGVNATAVLTQTSGVINAWGGIVFGSASGSFSGGSAALTNSGGTLYVGSKGIVLNTEFPPSINITLSGGTVGALANWASSMPMTLGTTNGNITFQSEDFNGSPWTISLSGPLSGPGGLNVTGNGTVILSGTNTYAGATVVSNGTLAIVTSSSPTNGLVTVDGSTGSPVLSVRVANRGQYWSTGTLTYQNGAPTADFQYGSLTPSPTTGAILVNGNVVFSVTPTVTVEGTALATGTYPLIQYTGTVLGAVPTTVTLPANVSGYLQNNTASKTIALVISSSPYLPAVTWAVGNGVWDFTTFNWKQYGVATNYANGDAILFDDTASGSSPITVTLNDIVSPSSITANNTAKNYIIGGSGSITGSAALTMLGGGTLALDGTNTYSGGTVINAGQLDINNGGTATATAIGAGMLTINAGALDNTSGSNVTLQAAIPESWSGNFTYVGSASSLSTGTGGVSLLGNVSVAVNSNNFIVGGSITDNGNTLQLSKTGNGALTLATGNAFTGGMTLYSGLLNLGDPNAAGQGAFTIEGGAIDNVSGAPLVLAAPSGIWQGSFSFLGSANLEMGQGLTVTVPPGQPSITVDVVSNTLQNDYDIVSGNTVVIKTGQGTWNLADIATGNNSLGLTVNAGQVNLAKFAGQAIGPGNIGLTVNAGALVVDNHSDQVHSDSPTTPVPVVLSGGVWDLNGYSENLDKLSLTNGGTLRNSASGGTSLVDLISGYTAMLSGTNCQFDVGTNGTLDFQGPIGGSGSLVKTGPGLLNLESNNTYTGNTIIASGTLALLGTSSISNTAEIDLLTTNSALDLSGSTDTNGNPTEILTLLNGQTLSGFGVVTGLVQTVTGATVAPGSSTAIGTLTITGVAGTNTLNGVTVMKLNAGNQTSDQLAASGNLVYGGALVLTNLSGSLAPGDSFTLFNAAGGYSGAFASIVPERPGFPGFGLAWNTNNLTVNGAISIVAVSVPPSPKITRIGLSGTTLSISGTNGVANEPFLLLESTNLAVPLSGWTPVLTNAFNGSGDFSVSIGVTSQPAEFFTVFVQ